MNDPNPAEAYAAAHAEALTKLDTLRQQIEDYPADRPTWSRTADLSHVAKQLEELIRFTRS